MKRIKLIVEEPGGVDRQGWPVTQGVPFEEGDLERGAPVRIVTAAGESLPAQATCLTTWREDLKYVKWLLVDFQMDLSAGQTREVYLEYGSGVEEVQPASPVKVERRDDRTCIDTGPMQVELRHASADFLTACRVRSSAGWRNLFRGKPGPHLYMVDQNRAFFDSYRAAPVPTIRIEDSGPMRASVCVKGYHASKDSRRFCPYVLRMQFYAGKTDIRFYHTFVFDQDPERIEISAIGMKFPLDVGDGMRLAFGGETETHPTEDFRKGYLLQVSDLSYRVSLDETPAGSGGKTRGWGALWGHAGSAVAVIRDMWQEYPKGIEITKEGIDIQIWPSACGETLKFSTPFKEEAVRFGRTRDEDEFRRLVEESPTAPLNLKSLSAYTREDLLWVEEMVAKYAPGRPASYNDTGTANGSGAAKTTEFLLRLSTEVISDKEAERLGICVQEPVIAPADPFYARGTGAMRVLAPYDPERFPEAERELESLFERIVVEPRRVLRTYGMIDYGDLMCSHSESPSAMWHYFKNDPDVAEKMKHCSRAYNNEANDQVYALWCNFVHMGKRKDFLAAEAYGEHMADVDIIHADIDGKQVGLVHYHNAHHWSGLGSPSHTCIAGLMLQYYLTGNRRILDICREVADWVLAHQEPCGIFRNKDLGAREFTTPVANALEMYQVTWERKYGDLAYRSLKWLALAMPEPGCFPESIFTSGDRGDVAEVAQDGWCLCQAGGMTPQVLYDAALVFGDRDPIFKETLIGMAHRYLWGLDSPELMLLLVGPHRVELQDPYFNASLIAYAYDLTEDLAYAAYCRYYLREHFPGKAQDAYFTSVYWGSLVPPMMEAVRRAEARHGIRNLDRAETEWVEWITEEARERPDRAYIRSRPMPPVRSLGRIEGYDE